MKHLIYSDLNTETIAILIKESQFSRVNINRYYINPCLKNIPIDNFIAFSLKYNSNNKITAKEIKEYLTNILLPALNFKIKYLLVADATYFKHLAGVKKIDTAYNYIYPCVIPAYKHIQVIYTVNYQALVYNPNLQTKIDMGTNTLITIYTGIHKEPGKDILTSWHYPNTNRSIVDALDDLLKYPELTCDIETTGLRFNTSELYTISFAWDKHSGIAFQIINTSTKELLKDFFNNYKGKLWFHNALFDAKHLIYHLYMTNSIDFKGMREGLDVFANAQDTMLYTYLALNSTSDIKLGLKANAQEYTGNYALDDEAWTDITKLSIDEVLKYNLIDSLATWYVKEKYEPIVIADKQLDIYNTIMQPSIKPLLEMMLVGLPLDLTAVTKAKIKIETVRDMAAKLLKYHPIISQVEFELKVQQMNEDNKKLKRRTKSFTDYSSLKFNPASTKQLRYLLYDMLKLPIIDMTVTKLPSVGQKTLTKLISHTTNKDIQDILNNLVHLAQSAKVLNDFISNFQKLYFKREDNTAWLNGDQILGGTQSGRLSGRNPNLQNLPSNSIYGKTIKSCFVAPSGYLFGGADFTALEDKIGAILSGDKAKVAEFAQGMDGHSLRAIAFFSQLKEPCSIKTTYIDPEIVRQYDITNVVSVNQFKQDYGDIRQEAKAPSFALAYGGTWLTLHKNIGLPESIAKVIEIGYQELYSDTMKFNKANAEFAQKYGYVECAFGLRLRTPLLAQTILGMASTPREAESEARSASNAITQSWGMLSNRAAIEIQKRIESSKYKYDIYLVNQIHDAIYFIWKNDAEVTYWLNINLIECMEWQEHSSIKSDTVKIGAELSIGKSWDKQIDIPNNVDIDSIRDILTTV